MHLVEHTRRGRWRPWAWSRKSSRCAGGTDGASVFSFMGLLCPNLCAGGQITSTEGNTFPVRSLEKKISAILQTRNGDGGRFPRSGRRYGLEPPPETSGTAMEAALNGTPSPGAKCMAPAPHTHFDMSVKPSCGSVRLNICRRGPHRPGTRILDRRDEGPEGSTAWMNGGRTVNLPAIGNVTGPEEFCIRG